ncbi:PREDICTED: mitochondrial fission regulator 1 [Nanorana parkeri]|uniref:mitochondrial fission regulator 1 n=1 Tax=Nanorana parkeri TaxID=125878 RepID=UPI0008546847|nr:PREDICTED: mitochondrial fission regulator 1 [Nanorana parkeri]
MLHWLLRLVRMVLQQVAHNMDSMWSSKPYGSSRSIVRKIGSNLPMLQSPRVHFQLIPYPVLHASQNGVVVPSFADVGWLADEEEGGEAFTRLRAQNHVHHKLSFEDELSHYDKPLRRQVSMPALLKEAPEVRLQPAANENALQKIDALENELANLRAQIAKIVTLQEQQIVTAGSVATPVSPGAPPPPPPPPPPLPPPPSAALHRSISAIDLIKLRKSQKNNAGTVVDVAPKKPDMPNMLDVLKDMNRVKLRSVKRTPDELKPKPSDPADPATLIAEALKKKFAYRYRSDSQGESDKPFPKIEPKKAAETPMFGPHMLKSTGKMKTLVESANS